MCEGGLVHAVYRFCNSDAEVGAELERGCGGADEPSFLYNVAAG
jgi:hypothetical protein